MPTGYTAAVQDGTVTTLEAFALSCARNFGALISMRDAPSDAPIPDRIEPSTKFHDDAIQEAQHRLAMLGVMIPAEKNAQAKFAYETAVASAVSRKAEVELYSSRYQKMFEKVAAWKAPLACIELQTFMMQQLSESRCHDCFPVSDDLVELSGDDWWRTEMNEALATLNYHVSARAQEIQRCAERNEWLQQLRQSLNA